MSEALELNEADYETRVANETKPVLLDFWSTSCGPCRLLAPTIAALAQANADKAVVMKVNVTENMGLAAQFGISAVPTLVLLKNGQVVERLVGVQKQATLQALIDANL